MDLNHINWQSVGDTLSNKGFWIERRAFSSAQTHAWKDTFRTLPSIVAGTGKYGEKGVFRTDKISWLDDKPLDLIQTLEYIKTKLNETCFLGLKDFDALYEKGGHYVPHVDAFQQNNTRVISVVIYLNESWSEKDGDNFNYSIRTTENTKFNPKTAP